MLQFHQPRRRPRVLVACASCDVRYELSIHTMRANRRKGIPFLCPDCRGPAVELTDEERESFLRWWRDQYSPAELERLGRAVASLAPL